MGFFRDWIKKRWPRKKAPTPTETTKELAPVKQEPVRSVDYGSKDKGRVGGVTIKGPNVWTPSRGGSGGGSSRQATIIASDFSKEETTKKVNQLGFTSVNILKPSTSKTPDQYNKITSSDTSLSSRPYTLNDNLKLKENIKLRLKKYRDPTFYKSVLGTTLGAGKYSTSNYPNPVGALDLLYPSLPETYRKRKGDDLNLNIPYSGTMIYNPNTGKTVRPDPYKKKTFWENIQTREIIAKGSGKRIEKSTRKALIPQYEKIIDKRAKSYQDLINAGDITVSQAQGFLDKDIKGLGKKYNIEAQKSYSSRLKNDPLYSQVNSQSYDFTKGAKFKSSGAGVATTGVLLAGSFVAPVLVGGAIATSGFGSGYEGISEKNYLKAGLGFGVGSLGVYGASRSLANQITKLQIKEVLATKPKITYANRLQGSGTSLDFYSSTQKTTQAYAYTEGWTASKVSGTKLKILGGRSKTLVYTKDYWTGQPLFVGGGQKILPSSGTFFPHLTTKGYTPSRFELKTSTSFDYSILGLKKGGAKTSYNLYAGSKDFYSGTYGAVSKQSGKTIKSLSGKMKTQYAKILVDTNKKRIDVINTGFKFDLENIGITKVRSGLKTNFDPFSSSGLKANFPSGSSGTVLMNSQISIAPIVKAPSITKLSTPSFTSSGMQAISGGSTKLSFSGGSSVIATPKTSFKSKLKTSTLTAQTLEQLPKSIPSTTAIVKPSIITRSSVMPVVTQIQTPKITQTYKLTTKVIPLAGLIVGSGTPAPSFPFKTPRVFFPIILPSGLDAGRLGKIKIPARRIVKYTPSYSAVVFKIFGKKPTGVETGLRVRPITKGFSFTNMFNKKPKIKVIKISKFMNILSPKRKVIKKRKRRAKK